jgi:hypothetical protein
MQKNLLISLWVLGGLLVLVNVAVYRYQRHYFLRVIEAWQRQDVEVRTKAALYDEIQAAEVWKHRYDCMPEQERVLQAIQDCTTPPTASTDSTSITIYFKP